MLRLRGALLLSSISRSAHFGLFKSLAALGCVLTNVPEFPPVLQTSFSIALIPSRDSGEVATVHFREHICSSLFHILIQGTATFSRKEQPIQLELTSADFCNSPKGNVCFRGNNPVRWFVICCYKSVISYDCFHVLCSTFYFWVKIKPWMSAPTRCDAILIYIRRSL